MTQTEALRLALEAFNNLAAWNDGEVGSHMDEPYAAEVAREAITAIKAALEAKDEPVATDWERIARVQNAKLMAVCDGASGFEKLCEVMDKYEAITPPQRTWVGLTDEEIAEVEDEYIVDYRIPAGSAWNFAKDIEAKLKEKNT